MGSVYRDEPWTPETIERFVRDLRSFSYLVRADVERQETAKGGERFVITARTARAACDHLSNAADLIENLATVPAKDARGGS